MLGPLKAKHVIATGESQSAVFMTTYVDAIDPIAKVYDGFYIHSRLGGAAGPEAASMRGRGRGGRGPSGVKLRADLRVPVMTLISETDLIGSNLSGFWTADQPDTDKLRIWEMPGTAHVDNYMFFIGFYDDGPRAAGEDRSALEAERRPVRRQDGPPDQNLRPSTTMWPVAAMAQLEQVGADRQGAAQCRAHGLDAPPPRPATRPEPGRWTPTATPREASAPRGSMAPTAKLSGFGNTGGPFRLPGKARPSRTMRPRWPSSIRAGQGGLPGRSSDASLKLGGEGRLHRGRPTRRRSAALAANGWAVS